MLEGGGAVERGAGVNDGRVTGYLQELRLASLGLGFHCGYEPCQRAAPTMPFLLLLPIACLDRKGALRVRRSLP